jgi:hypothetical protein
MSSSRLRNSGGTPAHERHHLLALLRERQRRVDEDRRAEVRRQDQDRVREVDRAPLAVGEAAVVEHLQQDVEDLGCAFSTSSSSTTEYGRRRTASVS